MWSTSNFGVGRAANRRANLRTQTDDCGQRSHHHAASESSVGAANLEAGPLRCAGLLLKACCHSSMRAVSLTLPFQRLSIPYQHASVSQICLSPEVCFLKSHAVPFRSRDELILSDISGLGEGELVSWPTSPWDIFAIPLIHRHDSDTPAVISPPRGNASFFYMIVRQGATFCPIQNYERRPSNMPFGV